MNSKCVGEIIVRSNKLYSYLVRVCLVFNFFYKNIIHFNFFLFILFLPLMTDLQCFFRKLNVGDNLAESLDKD